VSVSPSAPALRAVATTPRPLGRPRWERRYARALVLLDLAIVLFSSFVAFQLRLGGGDASLSLGDGTHISYGWVLAGLSPLWILMLLAGRCYEARYLGVGFEEFKRVGNATVRLVALVGFGAFAFKASIARGFIAILVPLGLLLLVLARYGARRVLHALRGHGLCVHRVVAVGSVAEVLALVEQIEREPFAGLHVVAVSLPDFDKKTELRHRNLALPNLGPARELHKHLETARVDTVAVAGHSSLSSRELRQLSWDLEGTGTDLVVAPAITDVTGPRIHVRPVAGLPLLHLEAPTFGGAKRVLKRAIDIVGALVLLLALTMPLLLISLAIFIEDRRPVFFRQERVGKDSTRFRIWKFRSMRVGAHDEIATLMALNESDGPLFKLRSDPRVTKVGNVLRKYSLDELPQLFNVLTGSMSLVGPRPPLPTEVDVYDDHVHRRLLVKPGMTGLWQVSGRADLPWEESVRLDLYYVENWSVALDLQILWKTLFAVVRSSGAY
jgi:exopolysaccharide biosynthesis polyprenyl glycosylphosphotransferase